MRVVRWFGLGECNSCWAEVICKSVAFLVGQTIAAFLFVRALLAFLRVLVSTYLVGPLLWGYSIFG